MFDGYDSCSEESTSSSSSDDSEDEVVPATLPIIKNNGQVYTYPDGKAGMGEYIQNTCSCSKSIFRIQHNRQYL